MKRIRQPTLIFTTCIALLLALLNFSEWYRIGILRQTAGYPFGVEGPPFYYRTAELYSLVNCIFGVVYFCLTVFGLWAFFSNKGSAGPIVSVGIVIITIIMVVMSLIPP
jgi:hypothetical protein